MNKRRTLMTDDDDEEIDGGKFNMKSLNKGFAKFSTNINPMNHIIKNKSARKGMIGLGNTTHDQLLPAVVAMGKPIYDGVAASASTLLTGNPVLGKAVADSLYNNMVTKPGYDPRQNQKSELLGNISAEIGNHAGELIGEKIGGDIMVIGGKVQVGTLKKVVSQGYKMNKKKKENNIDGYELDHELSGQRAQVYHNKETNHTLVNHRGTASLSDWATDLKMGLFNDKKGKRFNHSKKVTKQAEEKYKDSTISMIGHSLAGKLAQEANTNNHELITFNPAITPYDIGRKQKDNEYVVRSSRDPISALINYTKPNNDNNTTIQAKTYNPLTEHSSDILDRVDPNSYIGK
jgi:hypothetical protein